MKTFAIFGRDPALFLALAAAGVQFLSLFLWELTSDQQGALNLIVGAGVAVVGALTVAREKLAAALLGATQAAVGLALAFGLDLSSDKQASIMVFVAAAVGWYTRTQVTAPVDGDGNRVQS